jgi:hypothetical protein
MWKRANDLLKNFIRVLKFRNSSPAWALSPYPDGKAFGFTIIHDADSAYSRRLAPIIDAFDTIGLRITVTVFPLWAAWAPDPMQMWNDWRMQDPFFAPVAVPLEDQEEAAFYIGLRHRGHEIAMHTPSETSSTREDVVRAFALFEAVLGSPPRTYIEHSPGNNLDAQSRCGSDPQSAYYNTDLLNQSGCWVWVCDDDTAFSSKRGQQYNVLSDPDGPFCPRAQDKFGILRAFLRSPTKPGDGDGFLAAFDESTFDALERQRGLALVYTHLAIGWLDPQTRHLRPDIATRLEALAQRNVWFAPAATILDRFAAVKQVELAWSRTTLEVTNRSATSLAGLTAVAPRGLSLRSEGGVLLPRLGDLLINLGDFCPGTSRRFSIVEEGDFGT